MILPAAALVYALLPAPTILDVLQCFDAVGNSFWVRYEEWIGMDMRGILFCSSSDE